MKDAKHPIWSLARLIVLMIALVITLWLNASHFDETELRSIITMFIAASGVEGISQFFARRGGDSSTQTGTDK